MNIKISYREVLVAAALVSTMPMSAVFAQEEPASQMPPEAIAEMEAASEAQVEAAPVGAAVESMAIDDPADADTRAALARIAAGDHRPERNSVRDVYRHPVETLAWLGIRDDMTVVEIGPGGGWYLQIIAPFLSDEGLYYAANSSAESWWPLSAVSWTQTSADRMRARLNENADLYGSVLFSVMNSEEGIAPPESADMVLTFRNVHNWMMGGTEAQVFAQMSAALKPGGILGVIEHRGDPDGVLVLDGSKGYVAEADVIKFAEAAGLEFIAKSEVNANPNDTRDYEGGVWTLPPTLAREEDDRERYLAIGESDRMTMKFQKPLN